MNEAKHAGVPRYRKDMLRREVHHYGGHQLTEIVQRPIDDRSFCLLKQHQRGRVNSMLFSPDTAWASPGPGSIDARRSRMIANLQKYNAREALRKPEEITKLPARKKESAVNENHFVLQGKIAAVEKLGLGPLLSMIGRGVLAGGGLGALTGGASGFLSAPRGEGGRGFLRGALAGGGVGALGGGLAGGLGARSMLKANPLAGQHAIQGSSIRNVVGGTPQSLRAQTLLTENPALRTGFLGAGAGAAGAGLVGGGMAGAAAMPEPPNFMERARRSLPDFVGRNPIWT